MFDVIDDSDTDEYGSNVQLVEESALEIGFTVYQSSVWMGHFESVLHPSHLDRQLTPSHSFLISDPDNPRPRPPPTILRTTLRPPVRFLSIIHHPLHLLRSTLLRIIHDDASSLVITRDSTR